MEDGNNTFLKEGTILDAKAARDAIHLLEEAEAIGNFERAVEARDRAERNWKAAAERVQLEAAKVVERPPTWFIERLEELNRRGGLPVGSGGVILKLKGAAA